jgi:hypothetical protein
MANLDIHDDRSKVSLRPITWSAAIWASIIAGVVFAVLEVALVPLFQHQSPWAPLHMIGAIALGPQAMVSPDTFDLGVVATAVIVHVQLAIFYGVILAFIVTSLDTGTAVVVGAIYGLVLYLINFYGFTQWFPWFADARDWVSIFTHIVQSGLMAYLYKVLAAGTFRSHDPTWDCSPGVPAKRHPRGQLYGESNIAPLFLTPKRAVK